MWIDRWANFDRQRNRETLWYGTEKKFNVQVVLNERRVELFKLIRRENKRVQKKL